MTRRALVGLLGVTILGVACGTSPTAVEIPSAPAAAISSDASASAVRPGRVRLAATVCHVGKVVITITGSNTVMPNEPKSVRLRAVYYTSAGKPDNPACPAPVWTSGKEAHIAASPQNGFEATLFAEGGKHMVNATAPGGVTGSVLVLLD